MVIRPAPPERKHKYGEGGDAFRAWRDRDFADDIPECPYAEDPERREWEVGFDDAEWWHQRGQYL